jgi:predicted transcriptional regulator
MGRPDDSDAERFELYKEARWQNRRGHRVFPVDGKRPLIRDYFGAAPFHPSEQERWPWHRANSLGWALPPGLLALDVDVKDAKSGLTHLAELEVVLGPLPETRTQRTPSGGSHLVFGVPEGMEFKSQVRLPSGEYADIDLVSERYRYLRIYEPGMLDQRVATLPDRWLQHLTDPPRPHRPKPSPGTANPQGHRETELIEAVRNAPVGERNNTLFAKTALLQSHNLLTDAVLDELHRAALESGLDECEVSTTINSAIQHANGHRLCVDEWHAQCLQDHRLTQRNPRMRWVVQVLHDLALAFGITFDVSVRDLAEKLGVGRNSASRYLNKLIDTGHLKRMPKRDAPNQASTYCLIMDSRFAKEDTHLANNSKALDIPTESVSHVSNMSTKKRSGLWAHDAFNRTGEGKPLPISCVPVLEALLAGRTTVKHIADAESLPVATVRKCIHVLESLGIVDYDNRHHHTVRLVADVLPALDHYATQSGLVGAGERQRQRHAHERELVKSSPQVTETEMAQEGVRIAVKARKATLPRGKCSPLIRSAEVPLNDLDQDD